MTVPAQQVEVAAVLPPQTWYLELPPWTCSKTTTAMPSKIDDQEGKKIWRGAYKYLMSHCISNYTMSGYTMYWKYTMYKSL